LKLVDFNTSKTSNDRRGQPTQTQLVSIRCIKNLDREMSLIRYSNHIPFRLIVPDPFGFLKHANSFVLLKKNHYKYLNEVYQRQLADYQLHYQS